MSVWQTLAQRTLTRASEALGGSTCISSTFTSSPNPQHIAPMYNFTSQTQNIINASTAEINRLTLTNSCMNFMTLTFKYSIDKFYKTL